MAEKQIMKDRAEQHRSISRGRDPFDMFGRDSFTMIRRIQEDIDRLFRFGGRGWMTLPPAWEEMDWTPAIDAFQRGNEFVVRADIPGLSRDDLSVEIGDDALTIRGERKYDHQEEGAGVFRSERGHGSFCRVVPLPEGAVTDSAKANFANGVLEVVLAAPSQEVRHGRRLEIGHETPEKPALKK